MKYKRKFLVQGGTPKGKSWNERQSICDELCGPIFINGQYNKQREGKPCHHGAFYWQRPDYSKCIHPDETFHQYMVSETEEGEWQCNCKAWTTHKPRKDCKHIIKVKDDPKKYEIDPDWTGKTTDLMRKVLS